MLTHSGLLEMLSYDPNSGVFKWKSWRRGRKSSLVAGSQEPRGYRYIQIDCKRYPESHLAIWYVTGLYPIGFVDHINGHKDDNRIINLREASPSLNQQNQRRPQKHNSTGYLGVVPVRNGQFRAQIWFNGSAKNLGTFDTPMEAHERYLEVKREIHLGCTI